jgi:hypothetical protein
MRKVGQALAVLDDGLDVPRHDRRRAMIGDVVVEFDQIVFGLGGEGDTVGLHNFFAFFL